MANTVKCKKCGEVIDKTKTEFAFKVTNNARTYRHVECIGNCKGWEISGPIPPEETPKYDWKKYKQKVEEEFQDENQANIHETLKNHLGELYSKKKVQKELDRMIADGKTYPGIAYAIVYWVKELGHDLKEYNGSLAIIDYIYGDAKDFYKKNRESQRKNLNTTIQDSIKESKEVVIKEKPMTKPLRVKMFELD